LTTLNSSTQRILSLLKKHGALTAGNLAEKMAMTAMGARQHLLQLQSDGIVKSEKRAEKVGRPSLYWRLTNIGHQHFTDTHDLLSAEILIAVQSAYGDEGVNKILSTREERILAEYQLHLFDYETLPERLAQLVILREKEGYMASMARTASGFLLIEDHCPICHAAQTCTAICDSELAVFTRCFSDLAQVARTAHIFNQDRHCVYQFTPL
jgi:predicted ArsR family transcriptional regulator